MASLCLLGGSPRRLLVFARIGKMGGTRQAWQESTASCVNFNSYDGGKIRLQTFWPLYQRGSYVKRRILFAVLLL
jgi:hypothetical protein